MPASAHDYITNWQLSEPAESQPQNKPGRTEGEREEYSQSDRTTYSKVTYIPFLQLSLNA